MALKKIIVVCGPTASGKSGLALFLAKELNGAIINADSMQIYKGMDIGTAKPSKDEQALVPHYLFNVAEPDEDFDVARYVALADKSIAEAASAGLVPIITGGTGLYIRALLYGLCEAPEIRPEIREKFRMLSASHGSAYLYELLMQQDPLMASRLHPNDFVRIIRALEVLEATGESLAVWQKRHGGFTEPRYNALQIGVQVERNELYDRIDARVEAMLAQGFADEVQALLGKGYGPELKSMGAIGYKHMTAYLSGKYDYNEMVCLMQRDTRHYAKRQLTWFLHDKKLIWLKPVEKEKILDMTSLFLQHKNCACG